MVDLLQVRIELLRRRRTARLTGLQQTAPCSETTTNWSLTHSLRFRHHARILAPLDHEKLEQPMAKQESRKKRL
jgi:hypothetical protein